MFHPERKYMERAIELAKHGFGNTSPNPMVGAVIVDEDGRIIGEGYHRRCGEAHAEVNAARAVTDSESLKRATIYVTLEPCSHFGKTPPCSRLIIEKGIPRVVVGSIDPNPVVAGRGIEMLRKAGVEVIAPFMEEECKALNPVFFTAHSLGRPFVILKWAQTADGFIDNRATPNDEPLRISTPLSSVLVHRLRNFCDAILVGSGTILSDRPKLDCRRWSAAGSRMPRPIVADRRERIPETYFPAERKSIFLRDKSSWTDTLKKLYKEEGITSILVEGGASILKSFMDEGLYDAVRIEVSPQRIGGGVKAPHAPTEPPIGQRLIDQNTIYVYGPERTLSALEAASLMDLL